MNIPSQAASTLGLLIGKVAFQARRCLTAAGPDEVHDVRVAIRRLQQALRVFGTWLPDKASRKIRRRLKGILKTAGAVRDYDVAAEVIASAGVAVEDEVRQALVAGREEAATQLSNALTRLLESEFSAKWRSRLELDSADGKSGEAVRTLAHKMLPDLASEFIEAGARLAEHPKSKRKLHSFRISAKRFRYSLEPFANLYGSGLAGRVKTVRKVQDVLGKLNDAVATRRTLKELGAPVEALGRLREEEAARLAEFQEAWPRLFDENAGEKWKRFLGRSAGRDRKAAK